MSWLEDTLKRCLPFSLIWRRYIETRCSVHLLLCNWRSSDLESRAIRRISCKKKKIVACAVLSRTVDSVGVKKRKGEVFTGTFPVLLKAFIPASASFFLLYFGPNHHSAPFIRNPLMLFKNYLWLCIFVGHLNKNGAWSVPNKATWVNEAHSVLLWHCVSAFTPKQTRLVAGNK